MGAELVVLGYAAPVRVDHGRAPGAGADAIHPVVLIGEAAARPAQHGDLAGAQSVDDVGTDAAQAGYGGGVFADPDATVNAAAEMFCEVAVNMAADGGVAQIGVDDKSVHGAGPLVSFWGAVAIGWALC